MLTPSASMWGRVAVSLAVFSCMGLRAADAGVEVGPNRQVSKPRTDWYHAEAVLATDPKDAKKLLAASMLRPPGRPSVRRWQTIVYASSDSGQTWKVSLESKGPFDPALAFGPDGSAYFVALSPTDGCFNFAASRDGGKTWAPPAELRFPEYSGTDRPWITVDCTGGRYDGRVYLTFICDGWPLGGTAAGGEMRVLPLLASSDRGAHFSPSTARNSRTAQVPHPVFPSNGVILSDGTYVGGYEFLQRESADAFREADESRADVHIAMSRDGGETFGISTDDWRGTAKVGVRAFGGIVNDNEPTVAGRPFTSLAADPGSPRFRRCLYMVWEDRNRGSSQIVLSRSKDGGSSWSKPAVISDVPAELKGTRRGYAMLPTVAVSREGVVGVTWYDTRDIPEKAESGWDLRFRASVDGGETWQPGTRVSELTSVFERHQREEHETSDRPWMGHTAGLAADAMGVFHAAWVDNRTGVQQVWTASIKIDAR